MTSNLIFGLEMSKDLLPIEKDIIMFLCSRKNGQKIGDIQKNLKKGQHAVSKALSGLRGGGYIAFEVSEDEKGRPKYVSLTSAGKKLCNRKGMKND